MVTLEDIARQVGISRAAVSLALRDSPRIGTKRREQVKRVAAELQYEPDLAARSLRTGRTHTIGLVLATLATPSMNIKMEHAQRLLVDAGYQVLLGRSHSETHRSMKAVQQLVNRRVDGLILADAVESRQSLAKLAAYNIPAVLIDPRIMIDAPRLACVKVDRFAGTYNAVQHLAQMGHKDILFCSDELHAGAASKWHGVLAAAEHLGLRVRYGDLYDGRVMSAEEAEQFRMQSASLPQARRHSPYLVERRAYRMARSLARSAPRPSAVILNDMAAMAFVCGLTESGLLVPRDVAVVGFDGLPMVRHCSPPLTSIRQPFRAMARHTVELLMAMIQGQDLPNRHRLLQPQLVIRHSSCTDIRAARRMYRELLQDARPIHPSPRGASHA